MGNNITTYTAKQDIMAGAIKINGIASPAYTSGDVISLKSLDEIILVADKYYVATADLWYDEDDHQYTVCANGNVFSIDDLNGWGVGDDGSGDPYNNYEQRRPATLEDLFEIFVNTAIVNTTDYTNNTVTTIDKNSTESFTITLSILDDSIDVLVSESTRLSFSLLLTGSN